MDQDEIVAEVRREREKIAARFGFDLEALFRELKEEEERSGRRVVSRPPKSIERRTGTGG